MIVVDVIPDTPEWETERQSSIGASEVAAVMGLSQWATPLDVYKGKKGVPRGIDPLIAWLGHKDEPTIAEWVDRFSGLDLTLKPGFMARADERPWMHASFDRITSDGIPVQLKTAHEYVSHKWDEGIPTEYRVQVQAEMYVAGAERALVVVRIGARDFRAIWEPRDERFIQEHMLPAIDAFWHDHVVPGIAPLPTTVGELNEIPVEPGKSVEADETVLEAIARRAVLLSDIQAQQAEADALKVAIGQWLGDADTITKDGRNVLTFRYQKGRAGFDQKAFREAYPDLYADFVTQGAPFRVMRTIPAKEKK